MQPCVLAAQVKSMVSAEQVLLGVLPHPPVGAGQLQPLTVPTIEQTRPLLAQLVSAS